MEHGLSQSTVQAILQDRAGFIWLGTEEGLNRFDGYTFVVFRHDPLNRKALHDDRIAALHEDRQRRLWVGTWGGLSLFDPRTETFERIALITAPVTSIVEDGDGTLWFGTVGSGLFRREPATGTMVRYRPDPADPDSLGSDVVNAIHRDRKGRLWLATRSSGVERLEEDRPRGRARFVHYRHDERDPRSLAHDEVWGLAEDGRGHLWVATYGGGLSVLDPESGAFRHYRHRTEAPSSLGSDLLTTVFADRAGTIWIGTDGAGVWQYDAASDRFAALLHDPADPASLSQNVVRTLYEDGQGQLWVGTYLGGASVLKRPRHAFGYFPPDPADPSGLSDIASAFLEDAQGRIWVGTGLGLLNRYQREVGTFTRYRFPPSVLPRGAAVLALCQDRRGRIWMGTYRGGLGRFDPDTGALTVYRHHPGDPQSPAHDEVWALAVDGDGALWLGTNQGLDRFDPDRGVVTDHLASRGASPSSAAIRSLLVDRQGNLWAGSLAGLHLRRRGSDDLVLYSHDEHRPGSLSHDQVVSLHEDAQGRLWVGTFGGGLNRLDAGAGTFVPYAGFPSNVILSIQEDRGGNLWLSTNHGLSRLHPDTGRVDNFDLTNGLQSLQFRLGAGRRTRDHRLLFGSVEGFYDFDPEQIKPDTFAPKVIFTSLRVFNQPVTMPAAIQTLAGIDLSHQDKVFSLEFAALDYAFPRRNLYAYRLQGFNDQWIQLGSKREVTFTNLDPGAYAFQVKASNSDGVWYEASAATLQVTVTPPFWKRAWFRAAALLALALGLLGVHRLRVGRVTADLDERMRGEQALRRAAEAEAALRAGIQKAAQEWERTFDSMETPILIVGAGRVVRLNRAARDLAGSPTYKELLGRAVGDVAAGQPWQMAAEVAAEVERTRAATHRQVSDPASGRTWDLSASPSPGEDGGEQDQVIVLARDVTRTVELQESLRRSETMSAMGSLVAGVAHEVRNPLFGISANLDAFESHPEAGTAFGPFLNFMRGEVERLTTLMQDLLDYGRPAHEALAPGDVGQVVAEAVASCASLAHNRDVLSANHVPAGLPPVLIDRKRLVQVFQNILQNAIQLSPPGSAVALEGWAEDGGDGRTVVVTVTDSGPGFGAEDLPRAFEPFFSRRRGGTGMGLAIVQRIVEAHHGTVSVGNRFAGGAILTVRLPVAG
ncbi:MAG TPA: two-component regulator propeller domain-containing protein [Vicinamibacteria bacterium]